MFIDKLLQASAPADKSCYALYTHHIKTHLKCALYHTTTLQCTAVCFKHDHDHELVVAELKLVIIFIFLAKNANYVLVYQQVFFPVTTL